MPETPTPIAFPRIFAFEANDEKVLRALMPSAKYPSGIRSVTGLAKETELDENVVRASLDKCGALATTDGRGKFQLHPLFVHVLQAPVERPTPRAHGSGCCGGCGHGHGEAPNQADTIDGAAAETDEPGDCAAPGMPQIGGGSDGTTEPEE